MIPKIIHYCWFGKKDLSFNEKKCIDSWKKYLPDYQIIEWNESNYDVNKNEYIKEAYRNKKYAFVSDYARFDVLYNYGGVYFDTDVEIISGFDDILKNGAFMGCEIDGNSKNKIQVNPGAGMAFCKYDNFLKKIMDKYENLSFYNDDGSLNQLTVVKYTTELLEQNGLQNITSIQNVLGINIYPSEYFSPKNFDTGKIIITNNTKSVHWYNMSWISPKKRIMSKVTRIFHRFFGVHCFRWIKKFFYSNRKRRK